MQSKLAYRISRERSCRRFAVIRIIMLIALVAIILPRPGFAKSLNSALAHAYLGNPDLNQQRSGVRARDEEAPKALAGLRPKASISANYGPQYSTIKIPAGRAPITNQRSYSNDQYLGKPGGATLNVSQTLFDGGRTVNTVRQADQTFSLAAPH